MTDPFTPRRQYRNAKKRVNGDQFIPGAVLLDDYMHFARQHGRLLVSVLLTFVTGCSFFGCNNSVSNHPAVKDTSEVIVEPGRGVSNICEVGMTFRQIKRANPDARTHGPDDSSWKLERLIGRRYILISSLSAVGHADENGRLSLISFYVSPYDSSRTVPGLIISNRFFGRIGTQLSFQSGSVGRNQIEKAFGTVQQGVTNSGGAIARIAVDSIRKGEPYIVKQGDTEAIYYPLLGLRFQLKSNAVVSFAVSEPEKK